MVMRMRFGEQVFWIILASVAFFTLAVAGIISYQVGAGKVKTDDLIEILFVLRGDRRYAMDIEDIARYRKLLAEEEVVAAEAERDFGTPKMQSASARAAQRQSEIQQQNYEVLSKLLEQEKAQLAQMIANYDAIKAELDDERQQNLARKGQEKALALAKETEELRRTLVGMDAEDVAKALEGMLTPETGPMPVVDYMRRYMRPDFRSEVLTEMTATARQQILPIMANKYADFTSAQVLEEWRADPTMPPNVMAMNILQMPTPQAIAVYLQMDPPARRKLASYLRQPDR